MAKGAIVALHEHGESDDEKDGPLVYQTSGSIDLPILHDLDSKQHLQAILVQGKIGLVTTNIDYLEFIYFCCK